MLLVPKDKYNHVFSKLVKNCMVFILILITMHMFAYNMSQKNTDTVFINTYLTLSEKI